jgi:nucleotide-binding universal stress UspA family protein
MRIRSSTVKGDAMIERILIAIDDSRPAACAVDAAVQLAIQLRARLALLHVVDVTAAFAPELGITNQTMLGDLRQRGYELLGRTLSRVPRSLKIEELMLEGEPAETITNTARDWRADLIVIGSDSRGRLAHFLLGSTADAVIRRSPCPVLTVRQQIVGDRQTLLAGGSAMYEQGAHSQGADHAAIEQRSARHS